MLDDDQRELSYYGVLDGSTIYMHEMEQVQVFATPTGGASVVLGMAPRHDSYGIWHMQQQESELSQTSETDQRKVESICLVVAYVQGHFS